MNQIFKVDDIFFAPKFDTSNLDRHSLYLLRSPEITKCDGYDVYDINTSHANLFIKRLRSNHEVEVYNKLKGTGVCVKMIGISDEGLLVLEKATPLRYAIGNLNKDECIQKFIEKVKIMHSHDVVHGDLRLDNLLYKDGEIYICDFEIERYSEFWAAPEVLRAYSSLSKQSDIYSVGCTIYEIVTGLEPWDAQDHFREKVDKKDFSSLIVKPYESLIDSCLNERKL